MAGIFRDIALARQARRIVATTKPADLPAGVAGQIDQMLATVETALNVGLSQPGHENAAASRPLFEPIGNAWKRSSSALPMSLALGSFRLTANGAGTALSGSQLRASNETLKLALPPEFAFHLRRRDEEHTVEAAVFHEWRSQRLVRYRAYHDVLPA